MESHVVGCGTIDSRPTNIPHEALHNTEVETEMPQPRTHDGVVDRDGIDRFGTSDDEEATFNAGNITFPEQSVDFDFANYDAIEENIIPW